MEDEGLIGRLRRRMKARKIGQKALSKQAGLNETYVRDILKKKSRNPSHAGLQKLAFILECHVSDLTGELEPDDGAAPNPKQELHAVIDEMDAEEQETLLRVALGLRKPPRPPRSDPPPRPEGPDPPRPTAGGRVTENRVSRAALLARDACELPWEAEQR